MSGFSRGAATSDPLPAQFIADSRCGCSLTYTLPILRRLPLLLSLLLAPAVAHADASHRTFLYASSDGGMRMVDGAGLGAGGQIGMRRELGAESSWWFDGALGEGYYHRPTEQTVGTIFAGVRWQRPTDGWQPSIYLGGAHAHEADFDRFKHHPAPVIFAVDSTIHHRTGLGADVALSTPVLRASGAKVGFRFFARLSTFRFFGDRWGTPQYFQGDLGIGLEY